jgi:hypothetical protein
MFFLLGHNFLTIYGSFQAATLKTPLISSKVVKSLCLSFDYLLSNFSRIQVNKISFDGTSHTLFESEKILDCKF